jgi:hypothetical protein
MAEVDSHLLESGEDPLEAFGTPDRYVARLLRSRWHTARFVAGMATGVTAGLFVGGAASARTAGEAAVSVSVGDVLLGMAILVAGAGLLPVVHNRLPHSTTRVLVMIPLAVVVTVGATAIVTTGGLDERVAFTLSPPAALAVAAGLVTVTVATAAGPYLWRWSHERVARPTGSG